MATKGKELAKAEGQEEHNWLILKVKPEQVERSLESISGSSGFRPFDLPRIVVPAGGGTAWEIQGPDGIEHKTNFDAIILYQHDARKFWAQPFGMGEKSAPNCESPDGVVGLGNPGGNCAKCEFNRRPANGRDMVCKPGKMLYLLLPEQVIPTLMWLPLMSLGNLRDYFKQQIAPYARTPYDVVTTIGLEKRPSRGGGAPYAAVTFTKAYDIPEDMQEKLTDHVLALSGLLKDSVQAQISTAKELSEGQPAARREPESEVTPAEARANLFGEDEDEGDDIPL